MIRTKWVSVVLFAATMTSTLVAADQYEPTWESLSKHPVPEWFQDAKFGLFVHWGVYSVMGGGGDMGIAEWIMERKRIPVDQYEKLPDFFNPIDFDPAEWVSLVKQAGMKYITITSKHHDGFCLFDSKYTDFDIMSTPYKKDISAAAGPPAG